MLRLDKKSVARVLQWAVTVGLVAVLASVIDLQATSSILLSADWRLLAAAVGVALGDRILMIVKWIPLVRVLLPSTAVIPTARAYLGAMFASLFLPSSVGGDAVRAFAVGRDQSRIPEVAVSIFVERALGFFALCAVTLGALLAAMGSIGPSAPARSILPWVVTVAGVGAMLIWLPMVAGSSDKPQSGGGGLLARVKGLWRRLLRAYRSYSGHGGRLLGVGLLSMLEQLFPIAVVWLLATSLDVSVELLAIAVATPIAMFVMRLPIAIDGLGVVEGTLVYFLSLFGVPGDGALAIAVANRAVKTVVLLPGAWFVSDLRSSHEARKAWAALRETPDCPATGTEERSVAPKVSKDPGTDRGAAT